MQISWVQELYREINLQFIDAVTKLEDKEVAYLKEWVNAKVDSRIKKSQVILEFNPKR